MIAKIIKGTGFKGALQYVMNDKDNAHHDRATLLDTNCAGDDATSISQEMRAFADGSKISKPVMHIVLSHNKDNLSNDQWKSIASSYMEKMGMENHQYALVRHNDTDNDHCHLIVNAVSMETGKGFNTSNDRHRSVVALDQITKEMDLTPNPKKGVGKHQSHDNDNMRTIQDAIDTVLSTNKGKGIKPDDFEKSLKELGVTAKRAENVNGIQGYSFKVDGSNQSFTGKRLGSDYKLSGLEDRGLLTPKVIQQQADLIAKRANERQAQREGIFTDLVSSALSTTSARSTSNYTPTTTPKSPHIELGLSKQQIFEEEQKARELARQSQEMDFDAKQRQWAADRVRLNAERRASKSQQIE
jgi:hypothetical protein